MTKDNRRERERYQLGQHISIIRMINEDRFVIDALTMSRSLNLELDDNRR